MGRSINIGMWPNTESPLFQLAATCTACVLLTALLVFVRLMPIMAKRRDRSRGIISKRIYGFVAAGWTGTAKHRNTLRRACLALVSVAAIAVVLLHTTSSFCFAYFGVALWQTTLLPLHFVAGGLHACLAAVLLGTLSSRRIARDIARLNQGYQPLLAGAMLATGLSLSFGYISEFLMLFVGDAHEATALWTYRFSGAQLPVFCTVVACLLVGPQAFWSRHLRQHRRALYAVAIAGLIGTTLERFALDATMSNFNAMPTAPYPEALNLFAGPAFVVAVGMSFLWVMLFARLHAHLLVISEEKQGEDSLAS